MRESPESTDKMNQKRRLAKRPRIEKTAVSPEEFEALTNTPEYYGEESLTGSMPHPETDDDVLKNEQEMGSYTEINTPSAEEIDPQKQMDRAERARRRRRDRG